MSPEGGALLQTTRSRLKIPVSVVRFRPWAPTTPRNLSAPLSRRSLQHQRLCLKRCASVGASVEAGSCKCLSTQHRVRRPARGWQLSHSPAVRALVDLDYGLATLSGCWRVKGSERTHLVSSTRSWLVPWQRLASSTSQTCAGWQSAASPDRLADYRARHQARAAVSARACGEHAHV